LQVVDICLFRESASSRSIPGGDDDKDTSKLWEVGPESNVYSFGMLMLEIISGKLQYSEEGSIADWVRPPLILFAVLHHIAGD